MFFNLKLSFKPPPQKKKPRTKQTTTSFLNYLGNIKVLCTNKADKFMKAQFWLHGRIFHSINKSIKLNSVFWQEYVFLQWWAANVLSVEWLTASFFTENAFLPISQIHWLFSFKSCVAYMRLSLIYQHV